MAKDEFTERCIKRSAHMAQAMREARQAVELSQSQMAEKIGVSEDYIRRLERNWIKIPAFIIQEYVRITGYSPEYFIQVSRPYSEADETYQQKIWKQLAVMPEDMLKSIYVSNNEYLKAVRRKNYAEAEVKQMKKYRH